LSTTYDSWWYCKRLLRKNSLKRGTPTRQRKCDFVTLRPSQQQLSSCFYVDVLWQAIRTLRFWTHIKYMHVVLHKFVLHTLRDLDGCLLLLRFAIICAGSWALTWVLAFAVGSGDRGTTADYQRLYQLLLSQWNKFTYINIMFSLRVYWLRPGCMNVIEKFSNP